MVLFLVLACCAAATAQDRGGRWSVRIAESFMRQHPDSIAYPSEPRAKWTYEFGLILEALRRVGVETGDPRFGAYVRKQIDRFITADGTITTYEFETFNLDNIPPGRVLLDLYRTTGEEKYRRAAETLRRQLEHQPRTREGGYWHKKIYPYQMWLDGLYMAQPFHAEYARMFNEASAYDAIAFQLTSVERHTRDSATGLLYHAWDESRQQGWADPRTGASPHFWGRAMGWYAMGLVDVLDAFPCTHPRRGELLATLRRLAMAVLAHRDPSTKLWFQVVDQGTREGNYLETSASCMFAYTFAHGARNGYLDSSYWGYAQETFDAVVRTKLSIRAGGTPELRDICQVAGLGGNPYRDGSYSYYVGEPRRINDLKGVGPFILAALELEGRPKPPVRWRSILDQPQSWYGSCQAVQIADNVLAFQSPSGGWVKNVDMVASRPPSRRPTESTIDNQATTTQMRFLARVHASTRERRLADAFVRGLDYLLEAQYPNGGWPQFYPLRPGYPSHITLNDDAMVRVLELLQEVAEGREGFQFVDDQRKIRSRAAVERGIECILRCQVRVRDTLTAWCAQHDVQTFRPAGARTYELPSLSGRESAGIVSFLMRQDSPDPRVVHAIESAVQWLQRVTLRGLRVVPPADRTVREGIVTQVEPDSSAPPLWARFYDLETFQPFFVGRDGIKKTSIDQIPRERRDNYAWFGVWPAPVLQEQYPRWRARWMPLTGTAASATRPFRVGLDDYFNHEWRTLSDGTRERYHYTWTDTTNSGFSLLGAIVRASGFDTVTLAGPPTLEALLSCDVFIIVDPDTWKESESPRFMTAQDAEVIAGWVTRGGVLLILANDSGNCDLQHLNILTQKFGISFREDRHHLVRGTAYEMGAHETLPDHPVFAGVRRIFTKEVSSMDLQPPAVPLVTETGLVLMAVSRVGSGLVFAVGDPWLYNEYLDHRRLPEGYDNSQAASNLFSWFAHEIRRMQGQADPGSRPTEVAP
jgi:PelA/Pel-15E family pectate lyase